MCWNNKEKTVNWYNSRAFVSIWFKTGFSWNLKVAFFSLAFISCCTAKKNRYFCQFFAFYLFREKKGFYLTSLFSLTWAIDIPFDLCSEGHNIIVVDQFDVQRKKKRKKMKNLIDPHNNNQCASVPSSKHVLNTDQNALTCVFLPLSKLQNHLELRIRRRRKNVQTKKVISWNVKYMS